MKRLLVTLVTVLIIFVAPNLTAASPEIRVLIIDDVPNVTIEGIGSPLKISSDLDLKAAAGASIRVSAKDSGIFIGKKNYGRSVLVSNRTGKYRTTGRTLRGTLTVISKSPSSLMVVDNLSIEDYLTGLINSEISSSWPANAIRTQAVAARTYALGQIEVARRTSRPFDLRSTMLDQVYDGAHQEDMRSLKAVSETRGEVLLRDGAIFLAYYHSCCGGQTEHAHNVWPGETGPPVAKDTYCKKSPKFSWTYEIPTSRFVEILRDQGTPLSSVHSVATTPLKDSPRVEMLLIEDGDGFKMVKATDLRKFFGYQNIKSTWFEVGLSGGKITFNGQGYGHGVGLCQWGAKAMAEDGIGYRDILKFYYPDADIAVMY